MADIGGGIGLPTMSQKEMFEQLLGDDESRSDSEPEIAAAIGEQMIHMDLKPLPRSIRKRLRDITGRIPAKKCRNYRWWYRASNRLDDGSMVW